MSRWLTWEPAILKNLPESEPTKPPKPSSVGFVGSFSGGVQIMELEESVGRLQAADLLLAVSESGELRIIQTEGDAHRAIQDGFTVYSPEDAFFYITLDDRSRRLLHEFKRRFTGSVEWKGIREATNASG